MPCESPIWIRNRRYFTSDKKSFSAESLDYAKSSISLRPWDVSRQYLLVPCGRCADCLRRLRNDWYVRLERELAYQESLHMPSIFITITISPKYYEEAFQSPSRFIRRFNERIRHYFGVSIKHAFFQEFGTHPEIGDTPRLHFHGFLFGTTFRYAHIREAVGDLGWIWLGKSSRKRARYVVKYVVKQIDVTTPSGELIPGCQDKRFLRKFVSAHVGDYIGRKPAPCFRVTTWDYLDFKTGTCYTYKIPRYYNRYISEVDQLKSSVLSAHSYACAFGDRLVRSIVDQCVKRLGLDSSVSCRSSHSWLTKNFRRFNQAAAGYHTHAIPAWIDSSVIQFWDSEYFLI